jgi:hypothetical protein
MAFLTQYTFSQLCKKSEIKCEIDLNLFINNVYDNKFIFGILNERQIKYLFNYKLLIQDEEKFLINFYENIPEKKDRQKYVMEKARKLKYHISNSCKYIHKDFLGFIIPPEIKAIGSDAVDDYRNWYKSKGYIEDYHQNNLNKSKVIIAYNNKFPQKYDLPKLNEKYQLIDNLQNTNFTEINYEFDLKIFKEKIQSLIKKFSLNFFMLEYTWIANKDWLKNKPDKEIMEKTSYLNNRYSADFIRNKMKLSSQIKEEITEEILNYIKWTYNKKPKSFDNITLDKFGLEPCNHCS